MKNTYFTAKEALQEHYNDYIRYETMGGNDYVKKGSEWLDYLERYEDDTLYEIVSISESDADYYDYDMYVHYGR